jgi:putative peptidoglycan lipid II flippase
MSIEDLPARVNRSLVRNTVVMSAGTALSRVTGYLRLAAMAFALGVGTVRADAYNVANNTPNIVYELILGGVLTFCLCTHLC